MDSLHFIPYNILTRIFKQLTKYKNDYQQYLNYIYRNYTLSFYIYFKCIYIYILIGKTKKNPIRFKIGIQLEYNFASRVSSNVSFLIFVPSELIQCRNKEFNINES